MRVARCTPAVLIGAFMLAGVVLAGVVLAGVSAGAPPVLTVRVTSIDAALSTIEVMTKGSMVAMSREQVLGELAAELGVQDLSFLDLTRPAAIGVPQEGMNLEGDAFVMALPVRDGARVMEVLSAQFPDHVKDGDLTVFRYPQSADPEGTDPAKPSPALYAVLRGRILVLGWSATMVRAFDHAAALSGEGLPPGAIAFSADVEPMAAMMKSGLAAARKAMSNSLAAGSASPGGGMGANAMPDRVGTAGDDAAAGIAGGKGAAPQARSTNEEGATLADAPATPMPPTYDPQRLVKFMELYVGIVEDAVDSLSKLQVSFDLADGYLVIHGRGVARPKSTLAAFVAAQRDVGLPAIGRMMPVHAPVIIAGQVFWTEPSRLWMKRIMRDYQTAMREMVARGPESERASGEGMLQGMAISSSERILDCQRGDLAIAMDWGSDSLQTLQVTGVTGDERCRKALSAAIAGVKAGSSGASGISKEILEPEKIPTHVYTMSADKQVRVAQVGDLIISGTDPWASKAIREASAVSEGSPPGGGGLVLSDLGPFNARPGIFGRVQIGTLMRQSESSTQKKAESSATPPDDADAGALVPEQFAAFEADHAVIQEALIAALEGPAGSIPFAMRFDEGAATVEVALPVGLFDAYEARSAGLARIRAKMMESMESEEPGLFGDD